MLGNYIEKKNIRLNAAMIGYLESCDNSKDLPAAPSSLLLLYKSGHGSVAVVELASGALKNLHVVFPSSMTSGGPMEARLVERARCPLRPRSSGCSWETFAMALSSQQGIIKGAVTSSPSARVSQSIIQLRGHILRNEWPVSDGRRQYSFAAGK